MFGNKISVDIYVAFLDYRPLSDNDYIVKCGITSLTCLDASVATVLTCLEQMEKYGAYRQYVYAHTFTSHVSKSVSQFIEQIRTFVQI